MTGQRGDLDAWTPRILLTFSSIALITVAAFALFLRPEASPVWRWGLVTTIYGSICILGMAAVFFPTSCRSIAWPSRVGRGVSVFGGEPDRFQTTHILGVRLVHGHHPPCGGFRGHEVLIRGRSFCAGCTGLLVGAVIALFVTAMSAFLGAGFVVPGQALVFFGMVGAALGLFQSLSFRSEKGWFRVFAGALFVVGTFLILWGVDAVLRSLYVDLVVVLFSLLWLGTRIELSRWSHERICDGCVSGCEKEG